MDDFEKDKEEFLLNDPEAEGAGEDLEDEDEDPTEAPEEEEL